MNIIGIGLVLLIAYALSHRRTAISSGLIVKALALQFAIGLFALRTQFGCSLLHSIGEFVARIYKCADRGTEFIFGNLANPAGQWGFVFAIKILPVIIFFGALTSVLFHFKIIQTVVTYISFAIRPLLGTSGPETLCAIANSFLGQTEAPLLIRHYLRSMTKSELFVVMVSGMATISGSILVAFSMMGVSASHMLCASVMAIPGSILIAKMLLPEIEQSSLLQDIDTTPEEPASNNVFDAIATGTLDGLKLSLNVAAMLISFVSLLALVNWMLGSGINIVNNLLGNVFPEGSEIQDIFAFLFKPIGLLFGFVGQDMAIASKLMGTKLAMNELIAYSQLMKSQLSDRAIIILTYALCGFANFSCIGIQIGGIGALVPEKRHWLTQLGIYAVIGGTLSNILSAMIASLLL